MILANSLPMYQLRLCDNIEKIGTQTIITTFWDKYIIDDTSINGDFNDRRAYMALHKDELPYSLYPLSVKCNTLAGVIKKLPKGKHFVDNSGRVVKYIPRKFYNIVTYKVEQAHIVGHCEFLLTIKTNTFEHINILSHSVGDYVQLVRIGNSGYILYDVVSEFQEPIRRKL